MWCSSHEQLLKGLITSTSHKVWAYYQTNPIVWPNYNNPRVCDSIKIQLTEVMKWQNCPLQKVLVPLFKFVQIIEKTLWFDYKVI